MAAVGALSRTTSQFKAESNTAKQSERAWIRVRFGEASEGIRKVMLAQTVTRAYPSVDPLVTMFELSTSARVGNT